MKGVVIFLADGFEDMEALATRDVLVRGGIDVRTVSITEDPTVVSSHGVSLWADMTYDEYCDEAGDGPAVREDVMVFPGGMPGSRHLAEHAGLVDRMKRHYAEGGTVAAICAAPGLVLSQLDPLRGVRFTCFEGFQGPMLEKGAVYEPESVVIDGRIITGRGAGHAVNFGLHILSYLKGQAEADRVREGLML
ncbi:MAG: DJ-1/PfpI family protein [Bacteroidales bacterium]|nr:DJ-1/PfpI family protein [Bacteroidales bacterium]